MWSFGLYRATVTDTDDPQGQSRIKVTILGRLRHGAMGMVCLPYVVNSSTAQLPGVGSAVWVAFEGGDASRPVYLGVLPA